MKRMTTKNIVCALMWISYPLIACNESNNTSKQKKENGEGDNTQSDSQTTDGGDAGEVESDTSVKRDTAEDTSTAGDPVVLDHDDCQLDYAPASMTSYELDGRFVGMYAFTYDKEGNLTSFIEQLETLTEYAFEYEENRLTKTTRTIDTDPPEVYEATYVYDDSGLPTTVKGRNRVSDDESWIFSKITMKYQDDKLAERISWSCESEEICDEQTIKREYTYDDRGLLTQLDYSREGQDTRWEFEYDTDYHLIAKVLTLNANEPTNQGDRYRFEDNRLAWKDVFVGDDTVTSKAYVYEDNRLVLSKYADIGRYTEFKWTSDASACSFLNNWHLIFLHNDLGETSQEMLTRMYGWGGLTGVFY